MKATASKRYIALLVFMAMSCPLFGQHKTIDVGHYRFEIGLQDADDTVQGKATITFTTKSRVSQVYFDLKAVNDTSGKGMRVTAVSAAGQALPFSQDTARLYIHFKAALIPGQQQEVTIAYSGIPADGLIISKNKFGGRTFFADNWPERAHNWIPCNDLPSDKASVDFIVTAPDHYQVVANGIRVEQSCLADGMRLTHWKEVLPLPTKVMAIGVAEFAVQLAGMVDHIPVQSWVFRQNRDSGFAQYAVSTDILPFFTRYIGPYPYQKLANVQSKTRFGGLEDASNIFYNQKSVDTHPADPAAHRISTEALMAHETAHQWFGDEASEIDWPDLWLSEGFATYMTHLYFEYRYGETVFRERLAHDRKAVIDFYKKRKTPVVDTSAKNNPMALLNPNSYQKGSWVLHMLRRKLGDSIFQKAIRAYYVAYKGRNASTDDFRAVVERVSGQRLEAFFKQWLYRPGQPVVDVSWHFEVSKKSLSLTTDQQQDTLFHFPLQIAIISATGDTTIKTLPITKRHTETKIPWPARPVTVLLDPKVNLLFEGQIKQRK